MTTPGDADLERATGLMYGDFLTRDVAEQFAQVRAEERAKVVAEIVQFLRTAPRAGGVLISGTEQDIARLAEDIELKWGVAK